MFEPAGEECGTEYDDEGSCDFCGAGRRQVSDLVLDLRKAPKNLDLAVTIRPSDWIVSERLAELLLDSKMTGFDQRPVNHKSYFADDSLNFNSYPSGRELLGRAAETGVPHPTGPFWSWLNRPAQDELCSMMRQEHIERMRIREMYRSPNVRKWYQPIITSAPVRTVPPTEFGINYLDRDPDGEYRCGTHQMGLNLLSELHIARDSWDGSDLVRTAEVVGGYRGFIHSMAISPRARPMYLISQRFHRLLQQNETKGYGVEVGHVT